MSRTSIPRPALWAAVIVGVLGRASAVGAAELKGETVEAFNRYVRATEARMDSEVGGPRPLLWVDRLTPTARREALAGLHRGEIVVSRLHTREGGKLIDAPSGLIHHWVGTVFIAGTTIDRVVSLMQGYETYPDIYAPNVRRARTIGRDGDEFRVYLQLFMKKVISVVLNTENEVRYRRLTSSRAHVRSYSTRITEVQNAGTKDEREAPVGRDSGFLWRFHNYCSLEERSGGVYVQCESVSLSRAVPPGLGWLVGPFVTSIPRESLEFTLTRMKSALTVDRSAARQRPAGPARHSGAQEFAAAIGQLFVYICL